MNRKTWVVLVLCACCSYCAVFVRTANANYPSDPYIEKQTITVPAARADAGLGVSLAVSNGLAIAGAFNAHNDSDQIVGAAYAFRQSTTGEWSQVAKLSASDGLIGDGFGSSVGLDGNWAIVAADLQGFQTFNGQSGATYFFHRQTDSSWNQTNEFLALPNTVLSFNSVAINGSHAAATASFKTPSGVYQGVVDIYGQPTSNSWEYTQRITLPGATSHVEDIALNNTTLAVGDFRTDVVTSAGPSIDSVEVYENSPSGYIHSASIMPATMPKSFGYALALQNDRLLVGAPNEGPHGGAYIYERGSTNSWAQVVHLVPNDGTGHFLVGAQVALDGDLAYLTLADSLGGSGSGRVDVFQRNGAGTWNEIAQLSSASSQAGFGYSLATANGVALIGSDISAAGAVHVFSQVPEPSAGAYAIGFVICLTFSLPRRVADSACRQC
jgi:hypothetical protein